MILDDADSSRPGPKTKPKTAPKTASKTKRTSARKDEANTDQKPGPTDAPKTDRRNAPEPDPPTSIKTNPPAPKADAPSTPSPPDSAPPDRAVQLLTRIHELIDRAARRSSQDDFSVVRLFGALIQMLAIAVAVWGSFSLLSDDPLATPRLTLACFLQLAALTAFSIDRRG